jgi:hypothetical protein
MNIYQSRGSGWYEELKIYILILPIIERQGDTIIMEGLK